MPSVDVASLFEKQTPVEYSVDLSAFRNSRASREANTEKQEDVKTIQEEHAGKQQDEEKNSRTLFIGNLPAVCCTDKRMQTELRRKLSAYGAVESLRFRSVAFKPSASKRTAFITGKMDERAVSVNAYAVMETRVHAEEAASKENGGLFQQRHLRVDLADSKSETQSKKSIFIGNLPLKVDEERIWKVFGPCGDIVSVRVVRDKATNMGKGFGYATFKDRASVLLALQMDGTLCQGRPLRVTKCAKPGIKKKKADPAPKRKPRITARSQRFRRADTTKPARPAHARASK